MELPILCSFSGGRTSAFMCKFLREYYPDRTIVNVFANTGKETEQTLEFINKCDAEWGLNVVWLEAVVSEASGEGTTFKVVDFKSAARRGEPFEAVIKKYGIPSKQAPHCTRELKMRPIKKYMQSLDISDWITAIGIRADEKHRVNYKHDIWKNPFYPLVDLIQVDELFIRNWWEKQKFDLQLKDYQGNCDLCYKKSLRKRLTIAKESPELLEWWAKMEEKYSKGLYQFDQRTGISIEQLRDMSKKPFQRVFDKHEARSPQLFEPDLDTEFNCFCKST